MWNSLMDAVTSNRNQFSFKLEDNNFLDVNPSAMSSFIFFFFVIHAKQSCVVIMSSDNFF